MTMINLWQYQNAKKIRLTDVDGSVFVGYVSEITDAEEYMFDIDDEDRYEDGITLKIGDIFVEFMQSEIKSIEVLEE